MNLRELREEAWDIARETAINDVDRLWTKREMDRYINRVYRFIARETKCIRDASPSTLTRITVAPPADLAALTTLATTDVYAAQDLVWYNDVNSWLYQKLVTPYVYALSPLVLDIDECKWTNKQWRLTKVSVNKWQVNPWWEQTLGMPTEYCTDLSNNTLTINYRAQDTDTLRLVIRRMPLTDLVSDTDEPEFRSHYHDFMVNGILWQMYSKQDAEIADKQKATEFYALYMKDVDEVKQQETILDQRLKPNHSMDAFR
jgi:hypothetical protein